MTHPPASSRLNQRRGHILAYVVICLPVFVGFCSLAVDFGRCRSSRANCCVPPTPPLVMRVRSSTGTAAQVRAYAKASATQNTADGTSVVLTDADIDIGVWNSTTRTFTVTGTSPTSVRVTAQRISSRGTAVPTMFAQCLAGRAWTCMRLPSHR